MSNEVVMGVGMLVAFVLFKVLLTTFPLVWALPLE